MEKVLWILIRSTGCALLGGAAGVAVGVLIGLGVGWLVGKPRIAAADGALFGGVIGAAIGWLVSEPFGEWSPPAWVQHLPERLGALAARLRGWVATIFRPRTDKTAPAGGGAQQKAVEDTMTENVLVPTASPRDERPVVLFLCVANSARSQMAEALLKRYAAEHFAVYSAGLRPTEVHPLTVRVMSEAGLDISGQQAKPLRQYLGRLAVRVAITVCARAEDDCPVRWPGALAQLDWPLEDPAACQGTEEERLAAFRVARDQLDAKIRHWLQEIGLESPAK